MYLVSVHRYIFLNTDFVLVINEVSENTSKTLVSDTPNSSINDLIITLA